MEDARDHLAEDSIGSAKPPRPPKPHDPERWKRQLLRVIAAAAVAAAVLSGITAWETHQQRAMDKALYCEAYASSSGSEDATFEEQQKKLRDAIGC